MPAPGGGIKRQHLAINGLCHHQAPIGLGGCQHFVGQRLPPKRRTIFARQGHQLSITGDQVQVSLIATNAGTDFLVKIPEPEYLAVFGADGINLAIG